MDVTKLVAAMVTYEAAKEACLKVSKIYNIFFTIPDELFFYFVYLLFAGGLRVDSFIYSDLLPKESRQRKSTGLMHVSDWFPTMLDFAGIEYTPATGHQLDGYNQRNALLGVEPTTRDHIVYNIYYNVEKKNFILNQTAAFALRNDRYKLIHAYSDANQAKWYDFSAPLDDDSDMTSGSCPQLLALRGTFERMLFDLEKDPNETTNLHDDPAYAEHKVRNCMVRQPFCNFLTKLSVRRLCTVYWSRIFLK